MDDTDRRLLGALNEQFARLLSGKPAHVVATDAEDGTICELASTVNRFIAEFEEARSFALALAGGVLHEAPPAKNLVASPFKQLHAALKHLTWQTRRIADGDYSQKVHFMGDFSEAFNRMTRALQESEKLCREYKAEQKALEEQLHQAQKMEAIGQLAGGVAHDFNNILTVILGYSEVGLARLKPGDPLHSLLEQIHAAAERAAGITNGLLTFSRHHIVHTAPIDACGIVRGMEKMLRCLIPENIAFHIRYPDEPLIVLADKVRIEQVIMNLVANATDAMHQGGSLTISLSQAAPGHTYTDPHDATPAEECACIEVSDTGHGMDEATRERIFEPFFTTKEVGKGTGLGMAIIYGIVKQHNGHIHVESAIDGGTTIRICIPLAVQHTGEDVPFAKKGALEGETGSETLLLAEDDETVRELHKMVLENAGYTVIEAIDGDDALRKFLARRSEVALLLSDVIMPGMDGKKLHDEIRKIHPRMPVLFMSGYTKDIVMERGGLDREVALLTKPFPPQKLLQMVRTMLETTQE